MKDFLAVRIPQNEKEFYKDFARSNKINISDLIRVSLNEYVKSHN